MERNDQYYSNNYRQQSGNDNNEDQYKARYSQRGNYSGMPDSNHEYRNVRMQQRHDFNEFSEGPVGGRGGDYYNDDHVHRNRDDHYRYGDDNNFRQSHGYTGQSDYRSEDYRNQNYRNREGDNYTRSQPYSSNYDVTGNRQYARQENSYQNPGYGRRYSEFGLDERYNYGHELTDIHHDRGEHTRSRHSNDYGRNYSPSNTFGYDEHQDDYRYSGRIVDSGSGNSQNQNTNRAPRPSGPDYSKWSPIGSYGYDTFGT